MPRLCGRDITDPPVKIAELLYRRRIFCEYPVDKDDFVIRGRKFMSPILGRFAEVVYFLSSKIVCSENAQTGEETQKSTPIPNNTKDDNSSLCICLAN